MEDDAAEFIERKRQRLAAQLARRRGAPADEARPMPPSDPPGSAVGSGAGLASTPHRADGLAIVQPGSTPLPSATASLPPTASAGGEQALEFADEVVTTDRAQVKPVRVPGELRPFASGIGVPLTVSGSDATPANAEGGQPAELNTQAELLRLDLERQRIEIERERLILEQRKLELELEARRFADPGPERTGSVPQPSGSGAPLERRRPSERLRLGDSKRASSSGTSDRLEKKRSPRARGIDPTLVSAAGGLLGLAAVAALLYMFGDPEKLPFLARKPPPSVSEREPVGSSSVDPTRTLDSLLERAANDDPEAMLELVALHQNGAAGAPSKDEAINWARRAHQLGAPRAADALRAFGALPPAAVLPPSTPSEAEARVAALVEEEAKRARAAQAAALAEEEAVRARVAQATALAQVQAEHARLERTALTLMEAAAPGDLEHLVAVEEQVAALLARLPSNSASALRTLDHLRAFRRKAADAALREGDELARADRHAEAADLIRRLQAALGADLPEVSTARARHDAARAAEERALAEARRAEVRAAQTGAKSADPTAHIMASLRWLARHQAPDGSWSANKREELCSDKPGCTGAGANAGDPRFNVGVTALALLAFLEAGEVAGEGAHGPRVSAALSWLLTQQDGRGAIGDASGESIYGHAFATKALARAVEGSQDARLRASLERAVAFCLAAQNPDLGWKYGVRSNRNDTSVTGAMTLALIAARDAGVSVPTQAVKGAQRWFLRATSPAGVTGYDTPGGGSSFLAQNDGKYDPLPTMTAVALAARLELGDRKGVFLAQGTKILRGSPPDWAPGGLRRVNSYYWFHGALVARHVGGSLLTVWRGALLRALLPNQRVGTCADGSWDPISEWSVAGGRPYATAMNALALLALAPPGPARLRREPANPAAEGEAPLAGGPRPVITSKLGGPFQNTYMVRGRVRNEGAAPIGRLRVEIRLKSETGKVVATFPAECPLTLGPGEEGEYRGVYRADNVTVIHGFEVVAEDLEAEEPAPTPWTPADSAEDGAATGEQAPGAEGASGAEAALATLERAKDEIERAIRDRVSRFLRARSPRILHCPRCKGRAVTACDPCAGRGRRVVSDGQRTWTRSCVDCRGSGTVACSQETCAKGFRNLSLRRAFWDVLSPTALNKRDRRAFYDELANGTWSATFGPSLVVEDAEILAVTVHADRVLVEVRGTWSPAPDQLGLTPRPPLWTSVWIRERENFYLATDADSAPEPLFDSD